VNETAANGVGYASLGQRGLAFLIDSVAWLFVLSQIAGNIPEQTYEDSPEAVGVVFLVLLSIAFNYFWLTEWKWGKTVGKAVVRIHVTGEDGERPRFGPTTVRNLLRLVDIVLVGPLLIASSSRRQRLGDRLAHTVVVRERRPAAAANLNPALAAAAAGGGPPPAGESSAGASAPLPTPAPAPSPPVGSSPWKASIGIPVGHWGPLQVLWGVLAVLGLLLVESIVVAIIDPELDSVASRLAIQGLLAFNLIGVAVGFALEAGSLRSGLRSIGLRRFAPSALGLAAASFVAYLVLAAVYGALVQPEQEDVTRELGFDDGGLAAVFAGFLIVAAAPISEELFFRGFMYGGLRRRLPMWAAAAISGVVFGFVHYTGPDSVGVVPLLAGLGFLLAWLYERTGSLWPPILLHLLNNALALVVITTS
jgi:membrane protease YdiL (CAAX protease family)/uncharacterized RDD family membrane protein YckC